MSEPIRTTEDLERYLALLHAMYPTVDVYGQYTRSVTRAQQDVVDGIETSGVDTVVDRWIA